MRIVVPEEPELEPELLKLVENNRIVASILWHRGYRTAGEAKAFLDPDCYCPADPMSIPGIGEASEMLIQAIRGEKEICIYGDYDVDGITATALLLMTLRPLGARVSFHLPNRFTEGYGLSGAVLKTLVEKGCRLILTCDCGISNHEEVALAKDLGMKVIVTDHHSLPDQPVPADVIVNPKVLGTDHPCRELPGSGVAYMLAKALCEGIGVHFDERLLQLVALGIVADVVPIVKENRYLLQKGLKLLNSSEILPGLEALKRVCQLTEIDEDAIGFQLAPRLNAPGRVSHPDICLELLLSEDLDKALPLAAEIDAQNIRRRQLVDSIMDDLQDLKPESPVIVFKEDWHQGVIGIAAGRIADSFRVPVVLMTLKEGDSGAVVGSARSIEGVDIYDCLKEVAKYLDRYGGHPGAAGFSLQRNNLEAFTKALRAAIERRFEKSGPAVIAVDARIPLDSVTLENYRVLRKLAPFGEGNPPPRFYTPGTTVVTCRSVGDGQHQRLTLSQGDTMVSALRWWCTEDVSPGIQADVVYTLASDTYNGTDTIQLVVDCLLIGGKTAEVAPAQRELEVVDWRRAAGKPLTVPIGENVCCFAESKKYPGAVNRFGVYKCDTLVLAEVPPHLSVLKEMISIARCKKVVLGYPTEIPKGDQFLLKLMRVLKKVAREGGNTTLEYLASATGELEITVILGMRLLRESGHLSWEAKGSQIQLSLEEGRKISTRSSNYIRMREAERETMAFREFMASASPEVIKRMLTQ